ncbi:FAD binding domain protein [Mycobacterium xenopi 4042]|uniref:FAD binding domain protein n=1 Tax=Mycobacterium xenopi 4042 TaxID=1299334 RepID=X8E2Y7_MYCXE|nr:FAD binding domain protein [Mycobacterium xenopi 4042]
MVAALTALDSGLQPLVVEKQGLVGGSTGLSGGIVWLPNNPLMRAGVSRTRPRTGLLTSPTWSATSVWRPRRRDAKCF